MPTFNVRRIPRSVIDRLTGQDHEARTALLASDANTLQRLVAADALMIGPKGFIINRDTWIGATSRVALAWCVGILIVAYIFAMVSSRRRIS